MLFTDSDKTLYQKVINLSITSVVVLMLMLFCWLMHYSLVMPLFLLFLALHLKNFKEACIKIFLNLGLLLAIILFVSYAINQYSTIPLFYIPVASIAMLTMLLYNDHELSFIMAFASSVLVCLVIGGDFGMLLTFFIGSLTGAYSVRGARLRGQLIGAGLFVSVMNVICLFLINFDSGLILTKTFASNKLYPLAANGFISTFIVAAVLKIFEYLFHVLTNFSLLELSDFNQPLLKKMILEAPGTYHHSLVVSNLSEAAADSIGANALLARVGAYYHDIGKMDKPEYYTDPDQTRDFVERTGIDRLAVVIGNSHGISLDEPALDIERIKKIREAVPKNVALVLHGGSGIPDGQIRAAIEVGIANIHINTDIRVAYAEALREEFSKNPDETAPYKFDSSAREAVKKIVKEKLELFGAKNRI